MSSKGEKRKRSESAWQSDAYALLLAIRRGNAGHALDQTRENIATALKNMNDLSRAFRENALLKNDVVAASGVADDVELLLEASRTVLRGFQEAHAGFSDPPTAAELALLRVHFACIPAILAKIDSMITRVFRDIALVCEENDAAASD